MTSGVGRPTRRSVGGSSCCSCLRWRSPEPELGGNPDTRSSSHQGPGLTRTPTLTLTRTLTLTLTLTGGAAVAGARAAAAGARPPRAEPLARPLHARGHALRARLEHAPRAHARRALRRASCAAAVAASRKNLSVFTPPCKFSSFGENAPVRSAEPIGPLPPHALSAAMPSSPTPPWLSSTRRALICSGCASRKQE